MTKADASLKSLTLHFAGLFILFTAVLIALLVALEVFLGFTMENNVMGLIIPIIVAMQIGTIYFNRTGQRPTPSFSWKAALSFATTSVVLSFVLIAVMYLLGLRPEIDALLAEPGSPPIILGVTAFLWLLLLLGCRFTFAAGAKQGQKLQEKTAKRKASRD
ncbi:ABZJ_00895 family protein [Paracoccus caeni]|uniref:ABZJ_00895 family protein n=1 Tax=Paracoccus caeni TaxID=657651 RepID=A0A934SHK7_9RHOB|nr:ABZJ_00895 family protein [Paracoccus caeni]MBK4215542.1 ABZJ_00895 family protein [Paracoccus caeni]